jgi:hypothetical protein
MLAGCTTTLNKISKPGCFDVSGFLFALLYRVLHSAFGAFHEHSVLAVQSTSLSPLQTNACSGFRLSSQPVRRRPVNAAAAKRVNIW